MNYFSPIISIKTTFHNILQLLVSYFGTNNRWKTVYSTKANIQTPSS